MTLELDLRGTVKTLEVESTEIQKVPEQGQRNIMVGGKAQKIPKTRLGMAWLSS